jgi:CYTH domain-containing protein
LGKHFQEIERKWIVTNPPDLSQTECERIAQGYLAIGANGTEVRLRKKGKNFFLTLKSGEGLQRGELEIRLTLRQFQVLWPATEGRRLEKMRYTMNWRRRKIELDIYRNNLSGLVVAEVEFESRQQAAGFSAPTWFEEEVTDNPQYKNASLASVGKPS